MAAQSKSMISLRAGGGVAQRTNRWVSYSVQHHRSAMRSSPISDLIRHSALGGSAQARALFPTRAGFRGMSGYGTARQSPMGKPRDRGRLSTDKEIRQTLSVCEN